MARITMDERFEIARAYEAGETQAALAAKHGVSQARVSQLVRLMGAKTRQGVAANPPTFDVERAVALYESGLSGEAVAEKLGVSSGVVLTQLRRRGLTRSRNTPRYVQDQAFFSELSLVNAYWAGFFAADGCVYERRLVVGLAEKDRSLLEAFTTAARCTNPIIVREKASGNRYVYLDVQCELWVRDLRRNFNVVPHKAKVLLPPDLPTEALRWAFVRGYFDGDGHAQKEGTTLQITSGSKEFLEWVIRGVMRSHHSIYPCNGSWGCYVSGPVFREAVQKMYEGSTPETRLARKYERFQAAGTLDTL